MATAYANTRKLLSDKINSVEQKRAEVTKLATDTDREIKKFVTTLSNDEIANLVREIDQEFEQNQETMKEIERKNFELRRQLSAIQTHCKHPNEEVDSEGSMEIRTCKLCGHSRMLNYSTSHLHGR